MGKIKWTCTDPDNNQYGRRISEGLFEFKQITSSGEVKEKIDLGKYKLPEVERIINSFGYTLHKDKNWVENNKYIYDLDHKSNVEWIIAECIFESELI